MSLLEWTGHPFVDAGLAAVLLLANKSDATDLTEKDVESAIDFVSKLYARDEWNSKIIHGMIFPNNGILMANPAMKKRRTSENIAKNLNELFSEIKNSSGGFNCVICGERPAYDKKEVYRAVFPLLGSGDVTNYFHSGNPKGADICAHCLFLAQFMPIACYRLPRILLIHAYPYDIMLELNKDAIRDVKLTQLASNAENFTKPENYLFHRIKEITRKVGTHKYWERASINLYYFVCNNQTQVLDIIHVPTSAMVFAAYAELVDSLGWNKILMAGWRNGDTRFEELERNYRNEVYSRLLNEESILEYFFDRQNRNTNAKWELLNFYCVEVLGMDEKSLEFIKSIGDRIVETLQKLPENKLRDRVRELERAERRYQFEMFFIRLEKDRLELGLEKPLLSYEEFASILTAYGEDMNVSWRTAKNLLLFRIYERLHEKLLKVGEVEVQGEAEMIFAGGEET
ncbi:MAG: type I-B CRISPR-associated protein Cas8b1/Cst1 [Archaeoglobaceae archaeon]